MSVFSTWAKPRQGFARFTCLTLSALLLGLAVPSAQAGLFDDDEARRQINNLTLKAKEQSEITAKAQFELANQIQALREETARLRGQLETLSYELESSKKRQQDFYIDLDGRLRKFEQQAQEAPLRSGEAGDQPLANSANPAANAADTQNAVANSAAEARDYEAALALFKQGKFKESGSAFNTFVQVYTNSALLPSAQYWLGNSYYASHRCAQAIEAQRVVVKRWPEHPKAADALLNIASCQHMLGEVSNAKTSLRSVLLKYPNTSAAQTAKQRLQAK